MPAKKPNAKPTTKRNTSSKETKPRRPKHKPTVPPQVARDADVLAITDALTPANARNISMPAPAPMPVISAITVEQIRARVELTMAWASANHWRHWLNPWRTLHRLHAAALAVYRLEFSTITSSKSPKGITR